MAVERPVRNWDKWERLAPLTGVIAAAFWLISFVVIQSGDRPDDDAAASEFAAYFNDETGSIFAGFVLWSLGVVFFLWFLGSLRSALAVAEGGIRRVTSIAFGAGVATAVFVLAIPAGEVAGAISSDMADRTLEPGAAEALWYIGFGFFVCAQVTAAVFLAASALAGFRGGVVAGWLAIVTALMALGLLIFPVGWAVLLFGFPLWVAVVGILLWRLGRAGIDTSRTVAAP